jgi:hypothetical protein
MQCVQTVTPKPIPKGDDVKEWQLTSSNPRIHVDSYKAAFNGMSRYDKQLVAQIANAPNFNQLLQYARQNGICVYCLQPGSLPNAARLAEHVKHCKHAALGAGIQAIYGFTKPAQPRTDKGTSHYGPPTRTQTQPKQVPPVWQYAVPQPQPAQVYVPSPYDPNSQLLCSGFTI